MSDIGATSPGRWQATHLAYMIGATSSLNVGGTAVADAVCCGAPLVTVDVIPSHAIPRNTRTRVRVSNLLNLIRYTLLSCYSTPNASSTLPGRPPNAPYPEFT